MDRSFLRSLWLLPDSLQNRHETRPESFPGGFCSLPFKPEANDRNQDAGNSEGHANPEHDVNQHIAPLDSPA